MGAKIQVDNFKNTWRVLPTYLPMILSYVKKKNFLGLMAIAPQHKLYVCMYVAHGQTEAWRR